MPLITYKFADGHSEEIEVSDEVAAAFAQLEKYEKTGKTEKQSGLRDSESAAENGTGQQEKSPVFRNHLPRKQRTILLLFSIEPEFCQLLF